MSIDVHFSSKSNEWYTPQDFFKKYDDVYKFETDVCATDDNAKCAKYYTEEMDGLSQEWRGALSGWIRHTVVQLVIGWKRLMRVLLKELQWYA